MTQEEIDKAFEGRWNMKAKSHPEAWVKGVKDFCRDFFEAGIALSAPPLGNITVSDAAEQFATQDFEYWWSIYKKKRGKDRCIKKWMKLTVDERKACIKATPLYVQSTPDVTYRKDPYTYLHNKSWKDEIYFRQTKDQQRQQRLRDSAELVAKYARAGAGDKE